jgi:hypothetical protein
VPTVNDYGHEGKRDGTRAPPGRRQGRRGRKLPPSPSPQEGTMKRGMMTERRGK